MSFSSVAVGVLENIANLLWCIAVNVHLTMFFQWCIFDGEKENPHNVIWGIVWAQVSPEKYFWCVQLIFFLLLLSLPEWAYFCKFIHNGTRVLQKPNEFTSSGVGGEAWGWTGQRKAGNGSVCVRGGERRGDDGRGWGVLGVGCTKAVWIGRIIAVNARAMRTATVPGSVSKQ